MHFRTYTASKVAISRGALVAAMLAVMPGTALAQEHDLERLVQLVTDAGVELSGAAFGAFFYNIVDADGESYRLYALSGVSREAFDGFPMPRNTAVFAPTFEGLGVVRSDDITRDERYGRNAPGKGMPTGHLPVRSYLALPVMARNGGVLGGLFFGHPEAARFTARHEQLLSSLAGQAGVAIENARLLQRVRDESHRFANSYNAELRLKKISESILDELPGIGGNRKAALLKKFGSVQRLRKASLEDIQQVPGFGKKSAEALKEFLGTRTKSGKSV